MIKRVLIFSHAYYPKHVGGAEVAIKAITDRIAPEEIEFHMITNRFDSTLPKTEQLGNVLVHRVGFSVQGADTATTHHPLFYIQKILFIPQAMLKAYSLDRRHHYDGFWAMMAYMTFPITLLRLLRIQVPYAVTLQEGDPFEHVFKRWYIRPVMPILRSGFRRAERVQTISTFLADWARQIGYTGDVAVIPNGVDSARMQGVSDGEVAVVKEQLAKQDGETWLIHTGRYVHKNGLDMIIRSLTLLPEHVHTFLIGEGPEAKRLHALAGELGVGPRVHFHPYVDGAELPKYLKACDIFIRPSRSEGMGISFIEAMAAGLPVIATQVGGIADFLFDEKRDPNREPTGWAVDSDDPEQIANAVEDILARPDEAARTTENAARMVAETYDWDAIARDMQTNVFNVM